MQLKLYIHPNILRKCNKKHNLIENEIREGWVVYNGVELEDTREANRSTPPTLWFIVKVKSGRYLKFAYIPFEDEGEAILRSCYDANSDEIRVFRKNRGVL